ncbi:hypothetical protein ScPMuIL_009875 [Solemya velum]
MTGSSATVKEMMREMAKKARLEQVRLSQDSNACSLRSTAPLFPEPIKCSPSSGTQRVAKVLGEFSDIKAAISNTREMQHLIGVAPVTPIPNTVTSPPEFPIKKPSGTSSTEKTLNGDIKPQSTTDKKSKESSKEKRKSHSDISQSTECSRAGGSQDSGGSLRQSKTKSVSEDNKSKVSSHNQKSLSAKPSSTSPHTSHSHGHHTSSSIVSVSNKYSPGTSNTHSSSNRTSHSISPHKRNEKTSPKPSAKNVKTSSSSSVLHVDEDKNITKQRDATPPNGVKKDLDVFSNVLKPKLPISSREMMGVKEPLTAILTPGHKQDRFPFSTPSNETSKKSLKKAEENKKKESTPEGENKKRESTSEGENKRKETSSETENKKREITSEGDNKKRESPSEVANKKRESTSDGENKRKESRSDGENRRTESTTEESLLKQLCVSDDSDSEQAVTKLPDRRGRTAPVKEPKPRRMSSSSDSSSSGSDSSSESGSESESQSSDEEEEKEKEKIKSPEVDASSSPSQEGENKWSLVNFIPKGTPTGLLNVDNPGSVGVGSKKVDKYNESWLEVEFFPNPDSGPTNDIDIDESVEKTNPEQNAAEQISILELPITLDDKVFVSPSSPECGTKSPCDSDIKQDTQDHSKNEHRNSTHSTPSKHQISNLTPSKHDSVPPKHSNSGERHRSRTSTPTNESYKKERKLTPKSEKKNVSVNSKQKESIWETPTKSHLSDSDSDILVDVESVTPEKDEAGVKSKGISPVSKKLDFNKRTFENCDVKKNDRQRSEPIKSKVNEKLKDVICDRKENESVKPGNLDSDMVQIFSSVIGESNQLLSPLPHAPEKIKSKRNDITFHEGKPSIIVCLNLSFLNHIPSKVKHPDSHKTKKDCLDSKLTSKLDGEENNRTDVPTSEEIIGEPCKKESSGNKSYSPEGNKSAKRKVEVQKSEEIKRHRSAKPSHKKCESPERTVKEDKSSHRTSTPDLSEQIANAKTANKRSHSDQEKEISPKNTDCSPPEKPVKTKERRSSASSNSSQHSHKPKRVKYSKEGTPTADHHLVSPENAVDQRKPPEIFHNGHSPSLYRIDPLPATCKSDLYSRVPIISLHGEKADSADKYLAQAKELKHKADTLKDKLAKLLTYIEAVLSFLQCGCAMEREHISEAHKIFTMYKDTFRLITHICRFRSSHETDLSDKEKKLSVLSLRIQSLLCLKLFNLKKQETLKLKKIIDDHNKATGTKPSGHAPSPCQTGWGNRTTGTPSPMSPTPSPAGSVGSVGSQGSCNDLTPSKLPNGNLGTGSTMAAHGTVAVPQRIHSISQHYLKIVNYVVQCHDYWDQADIAKKDYEDFFKTLDKSDGQLSLHSSIPELVRYICLGLQHLKDT